MSRFRRPIHIPSLNVVLLLASDDEAWEPIQNAVSTAGYQVLEAKGRPRAESILREFEGRVDLILTCVHSDAEAYDLEQWSSQHGSVPLLALQTGEGCETAFLPAEMALRVRLALEAAQPARSIVIADEDEHERQGIAGLLDAAGYRVRQAPGGKVALKLFAQSAPDLLLTDVFMSEMDGLELIQKVRKLYPQTAIVAMSGNGFLNVAEFLGARAILDKPVRLDPLLQTLREVAEWNCREPASGPGDRGR